MECEHNETEYDADGNVICSNCGKKVIDDRI